MQASLSGARQRREFRLFDVDEAGGAGSLPALPMPSKSMREPYRVQSFRLNPAFCTSFTIRCIKLLTLAAMLAYTLLVQTR